MYCVNIVLFWIYYRMAPTLNPEKILSFSNAEYKGSHRANLDETKNQIKEDDTERKHERREQIALTEERKRSKTNQRKSEKEIVQRNEKSLKSQTWVGCL